MTEVDNLFLSRAEIGALTELLAEIPALVEELAIVETRQARMQRRGAGALRRTHPSSRAPLHWGAFGAAEALRNEIGGWIRVVCEQRAVPVPAVDDLASAAKWLKRHIFSLATTEGADGAYGGIQEAIMDCRREIDLPPDDEIHVSPAQLTAANNSIVTAYQVQRIATKLGPIGQGLNRDRVQYLKKVGAIHAVARDGDTHFFRLGDVLVAHAARQKGSAA